MPRNEYDAQIKALRQPTSVPDDVGVMGAYTHPVTNERLSALATDSHAGPTATIQFEDTGKLANIYPGDELPDGFVVEEITPEGVVVLPETGPRQLWQMGQSERPISTRYTQEDEDALNRVRDEMRQRQKALLGPDGPGGGDGPVGGDVGENDGKGGPDNVPDDFYGYGAKHIYGTDVPEEANDRAQEDLRSRIEEPEDQFQGEDTSENTISWGHDPNWDGTNWTLYTIKGEDMTRFFLVSEDGGTTLNMTGHDDFPQPDEE